MRATVVVLVISRVRRLLDRLARESKIVERWRRRRYLLFDSTCVRDEYDPILDIGGGTGRALARYNHTNPITIVEPGAVWDIRVVSGPNVSYAVGDGRHLDYEDGSWPVVFSNSVIEHVGGPADQALFADEIRRVADRYFVQTPNKWFPVEPHFRLPFVQFLPRPLWGRLNARLRHGGEEIHLLSRRDMKRLFPDAEIHRERTLGLTKSLIAIRRGR